MLVGGCKRPALLVRSGLYPPKLRIVGTTTCVAFAAGGSFLATGGADKLVKLWNSKDGGTTRSSPSALRMLTAVCVQEPAEALYPGAAT